MYKRNIGVEGSVERMNNIGNVNLFVILRCDFTNQQCHDLLRKERMNNIGNECMVVVKHFEENECRFFVLVFYFYT